MESMKRGDIVALVSSVCDSEAERELGPAMEKASWTWRGRLPWPSEGQVSRREGTCE